MEFLLLWADNLDDALCALRHLAPKILSFVAAFVLFAATGFALVMVPQAALATIALVLSAALIEQRVRRHRAATANNG